MPTYRYQFADLATGQFLEELPVGVRTYSQQINGVGQASGTLALTDLGAGVDWRSATTERRTLLVVLRDQQIAWAGPVTKRRPADSGNSAEISAETLEGYWGRRKIKADTVFTGSDVFDLVRTLVTNLQAVTGGNIRMQVVSGLAGWTQTITYAGKDRTKALDAWTRLAEVSPGFEFTITWSASGSPVVFTPTLQLASPGLSVGLDATVLQYPGNLQSYDYPEDGTLRPNALTGIGADAAGVPLLSEQVDTADLAAGVPLYEDEISLKDETDATRLATRTLTALNAAAVDYVIPTATLRSDTDPDLGDLPLGAPVRLLATSPYHPAGADGRAGIDVTRRVTGWTVTPSPRETVALTLGSTTGKVLAPARRRDQAAYLRDLDRRLRTLETA
jgi:hypothetical protein